MSIFVCLLPVNTFGKRETALDPSGLFLKKVLQKSFAVVFAIHIRKWLYLLITELLPRGRQTAGTLIKAIFCIQYAQTPMLDKDQGGNSIYYDV